MNESALACVLVFCSKERAGGGFLNGQTGQEEDCSIGGDWFWRAKGAGAGAFGMEHETCAEALREAADHCSFSGKLILAIPDEKTFGSFSQLMNQAPNSLSSSKKKSAKTKP